MATLNFDARTVAPDQGRADAIPAGWYNVIIDESEMKPTKDNATTGGAYLQLRFNIIDGQYAGRKVFSRLNLRNANAQAQSIAYGQLSAICHAVGAMQVGESHELHGKPMKIKVKFKPADGEYEASNDVTAYKNINDTSVGAPGAAAPGAGFAAPAGFGAAPAGFGGAPAQAGFAPQAAPAQAAPAAGGWQPQAAPAQAAPAQFAQPAQGAAQQPWQQGAPAQGAPVQQQAGAAQPWQQGAPAQGAPVQQAAPAQGAPAAGYNPAAAAAQGATPPWAQG